jgi:glucose-6-phosphate 1-dehydrogenase
LSGNLSDHFAIIIIDGVEISLNKLRQHFYEGVQQFSNEGKINKEKWNKFASHILYLNGDFLSSSTYTKLTHQCKQLETKWNFKANIIFYMATPPSLFGEIPKYLHQEGLSKDREHTRIVVEKPIGYDLQTAQELNRKLGKYFEEKQIFRIDHYLGKETVQNILAFRFANSLFEPIWNRRYIDFIAITVAEEVGVEHRGGYYDHAGAFRDMVQNHLMQLLCLIAMEPMLSFDADEIRNKKVDVLRAVRLIPQEMIQHFVVSGQYSAGRIHGKKVCGYRQEPSVSPDSLTETFVALKIFIDNWRWQGIPFYIRTGKRMPCQASEVVIQFRAVPHQAFPPEATHNWQPSRLVLSIQPQEGIVLCLQAKYPGQEMHLRNVDMKFNYQDAFEVRSPDAYETLLLDIMKNDLTLFMRADQVEIAWKLWMPIIEMWKTSPPGDFPNYEAGTWGPEASNILLAQNGHSWPLPISIKEKFIKQLF